MMIIPNKKFRLLTSDLNSLISIGIPIMTVSQPLCPYNVNPYPWKDGLFIERNSHGVFDIDMFLLFTFCWNYSHLFHCMLPLPGNAGWWGGAGIRHEAWVKERKSQPPAQLHVYSTWGRGAWLLGRGETSQMEGPQPMDGQVACLQQGTVHASQVSRHLKKNIWHSFSWSGCSQICVPKIYVFDHGTWARWLASSDGLTHYCITWS